MSKIQMEYPFTRISGKPVRECDTVFSMRYGQPYLYGRDRSRTRKQSLSDGQFEQQEHFKRATAATMQIMHDPDRLKQYIEEWKAVIKSGNNRYKTLRGYIFAQVYNE